MEGQERYSFAPPALPPPRVPPGVPTDLSEIRSLDKSKNAG